MHCTKLNQKYMHKIWSKVHMAQTRAWRQIHVPFASIDQICRQSLDPSKIWWYHKNSTQVIPFSFSKLGSQNFISFTFLIQMAGLWIHHDLVFKKKRYRYCNHSLWNTWESITKKDPTRQWNSYYYRISSNQGFIKFEKIKIKAWSFHGTAAVCETHWSYRHELYRFLEARPNYWFGYWKAFWLWALVWSRWSP